MRPKPRTRRERVSLLSRYSADLGQFLSRERSERALRAAAMEQAMASRAKSEFLANMSHELRTPLNAIIGFSDLIRQSSAGNSKFSEYSDLINSAGKHLLHIISDILDISKIESGTFELSLEHHPLLELIQSSIALVETRIVEKKQTLWAKLPASLPVMSIDGRRLKQVLINLLSNAHKFTPEGGNIVVSAAQLADGKVLIGVQDSGIGMSEDQIRIALTPFGQVHSSLSRNHEGTGLGLPIAKALVEQQGGKFEIASKERGGTSVTISFPAGMTVHRKQELTG